MRPPVSRRVRTVSLLLAAAALAAGCGVKGQTRFQDARRTGVVNSQPADLGTMPDGYSNYATKCDHGNRVYVLFHEDSAYGGIFVVQNDKTCRQQ